MNKVIDQAIELKEQAVQRITNELQSLITERLLLQKQELEVLAKYKETPLVVENFANYKEYKLSLLNKIESIHSRLNDLQSTELQVKERLVAANIDKEKFVRFKKKQLNKKQVAADKREQKQFDELATNAYIRKQKENDLT